MSLPRPDGVADLQDAAADDLGPQPAAVQQPLLDAAQGGPFEVVARLAQPDAAEDGGADGEGAADEVVERHGPGEEVPPRPGRLQGEAALAGQGFERLALDERHFLVGLAEAGLPAVAVAGEADARDRLDPLDAEAVAALALREEDGQQLALEHGAPEVQSVSSLGRS